MRKRPIKAVLFDMGNTLLEFENRPWEGLLQQGMEAIYDAWHVRGGALPDRQDFCQHFRTIYNATWKEAEQTLVEMELRVLVEGTAKQLGLILSDADVWHLVRAHYQPIAAQVTIYPDTLQTLVDIRSRGLKVGLISNTMWPGALHKEDLERFGIVEYFDHLLFSADVGVRKPHPRIYQRALEALAVAPHEAVFVGDRFAEDIAGPKRLGMLGVWKEQPGRERDPTVVPDAQIAYLRELLTLLDAWTEGDGT